MGTEEQKRAFLAVTSKDVPCPNQRKRFRELETERRSLPTVFVGQGQGTSRMLLSDRSLRERQIVDHHGGIGIESSIPLW